MGIAIKVDNLSKAYQLGDTSTPLSIKYSHIRILCNLKRWAYTILGKEDPFLKIGEITNFIAPEITDFSNSSNRCYQNI